MNYIYRMTHIDNIPHILRYGITHRNSNCANPDYKAIGDNEIIRKRTEQERTTTNGEVFVPGDYIPFYFYARMPMLYNIQHGYHVPMIPPEDIVYLIVKLQPIVEDPSRTFFFSDGHAISKMTQFYGRESIREIDIILDKNAILNNDWGDDYLVRERKQAEFLVEGDIPMNYVVAMCCYSEASQKKLLDMGVLCDIKVSPKAYY